MTDYPQPGATLFGQAVARRGINNPRDTGSWSSDDDDSIDDGGGNRRVNEYSNSDPDDGEISDAGTIYSTNESARRTPAQLQKEELIQKQGILRELIQMKRDGIDLGPREYTENDSLAVLSHVIEHHKQRENENTMVGMYKVVINMGCHGLQMLNTIKGPWIPMEGWAEAVTKDMNVYDRPLRRIHRQYFARGPAGNPWVELGFALIGSLIFHVMVAKMMGTRNGADMFAKMFNGGGTSGVMNALSGGGAVGPGVGMPQAVPNTNNQWANHNVPQVPRQQQATTAPPPQQVHVPPPQARAPQVPRHQPQQAAPIPQTRAPVVPSVGGGKKKRKPMRRPGFTRRAAPVQQSTAPPMAAPPAYQREPVHHDMGSESTLNLDDE